MKLRLRERERESFDPHVQALNDVAIRSWTDGLVAVLYLNQASEKMEEFYLACGINRVMDIVLHDDS